VRTPVRTIVVTPVRTSVVTPVRTSVVTPACAPPPCTIVTPVGTPVLRYYPPVSATRYGVSPWLHRRPARGRATWPVFTGEAEAAVVIIGGGLTGVMTAYACAVAGLAPVLLEAERMGSGGSGLGPGVCVGEATGSFVALERAIGRRAARAHFDQTRRAVLDLRATLRRLAPRGSVLSLTDAWRVVPEPQPAKAAQAEATARRGAGMKAAWHGGPAASRATGIDVQGGLRLADWALTDPFQTLGVFQRAAIARGARVFERSPVTRVTITGDRARVTTARGQIVTPWVVHATGEPTTLVPALRRHFTPACRALALSAVLPAAIRPSLGPRDTVVCDVDEPPHLVRWTDDHRVLVAGADGPRPTPARRDAFHRQRTGQLMYELSRLFPAISGTFPDYGWSLPTSTSSDGGVVVGLHRNYPRQLFGFATLHDPARAFLASRILTRYVLGTRGRDDGWFGLGRGR
jgi:glycine/D-amino acid oxidase-like deaminating enzyme